MGIDILIPFIILLVLVVYLIYTRYNFEQTTIKDYETKFEEWKKHASPEDKEKKESKKELVGLVFKKDGKIDIEMFDEYSQGKIERKKFNIKTRS